MEPHQFFESPSLDRELYLCLKYVGSQELIITVTEESIPPKEKEKKSTCKFLVLISYPNKTVELSKMKNNAFVGQHHYHIALKHIRKMSKVNKRISISFAKL